MSDPIVGRGGKDHPVTDPLEEVRRVIAETETWCKKLDGTTHHEWCGCQIAARLSRAVEGLEQERGVARALAETGMNVTVKNAQAEIARRKAKIAELEAALAEKERDVAEARRAMDDAAAALYDAAAALEAFLDSEIRWLEDYLITGERKATHSERSSATPRDAR